MSYAMMADGESVGDTSREYLPIHIIPGPLAPIHSQSTGHTNGNFIGMRIP